MQITLNVDPNALTKEVADFVQALTVEDKNALVKEVVSRYYADYKTFEQGERQQKESEAIKIVKANFDNYDQKHYTTDESVKGHHRYREIMNGYKSFAEQTRIEISEQMRKELSVQIKTFIETDEDYQKLLKESMEAVKAAFPDMVKQAMVLHMNSQLSSIQQQIYDLANRSSDRIQSIEQRLLR